MVGEPALASDEPVDEFGRLATLGIVGRSDKERSKRKERKKGRRKVERIAGGSRRAEESQLTEFNTGLNGKDEPELCSY